jgi:hypothetical protein
MRALTLAGMAEERDEVREHVAELEHAGKLPDNFNYIFETFDAGEPGVLRRTLSFQGFQQCRQFCITLESADEREARNLVLAPTRCPT